MKVIAICSSPRKSSNSRALAENFLAGAKENGADTELIILSGKNIKACHADGSCKADQAKRCAVSDDMQAIYDSITAADVIAFASPVYFSRMNGPMYTFIDRLYGLIGPQGSRIPAGKKAVSFLTCGGGPEEVMVQIHKDLMSSLSYFGMQCAGKVLVSGVNPEGEITKFPEKLAEAKALGKSLSA
ncbi:MAG TPA: flavodoxin family protein [Methanocorpusculum sp.]|nr:flavodoxin family protein [Methanocorpusculum sp.]